MRGEDETEAGEDLKRKQLLFSGLDRALESDEDDTPDIGRLSSMQAMQKAATRQEERCNQSKTSNTRPLPRSVSEGDPSTIEVQSTAQIIPSSSDPQASSTAAAGMRHERSKQPKTSTSEVGTSSSATSRPAGKRKRESTNKSIPLNQQIFNGLRFYFFPNSDKHPARKIRIAKAVDFGATWERDYNDNVTHIIIDKTMDYPLLTKFLKKDALAPRVVVVSENYPAECITYKTLLDPRQPQFKVKGYLVSPTSSTISASSNRSLELKPAGESVQCRAPETPVDDDRVPSSFGEASEKLDAVADDDASRRTSNKLPVAEVESTTEFDAAIQHAKTLQHLPLDFEEEPTGRPTTSDGATTDDEQPATKSKADEKKTSKFRSFQDRFSCMQKHTGSDKTPNAATIAILQQMADYYEQIGDEWRTRAYRKAISTLRNHPTKVWTREEALALPQIGERLASKIEEIAYTNRLRRLDNARLEPSDQVLQTFMKIYGAGFAQASKWVNAGYTTLDQLLAKAELTDNQRIGIEHYADFNSRIPRAEVAQHGEVVRKTLRQIDPAFKVIVGGSYRRGAETSGDIDCIITRANSDMTYIRPLVLDQLVPKLFATGFLVAELAATSRQDGSKWHGASRLPADGPTTPWRRIDLLLVPSDELGAALIYFTGNDIFNRSLRLLASTKGMRLNQRGLYKDVIRGKGREKLSEGTLVEGKDEKKIFEVLGVPWRPPEHRIC